MTARTELNKLTPTWFHSLFN